MPNIVIAGGGFAGVWAAASAVRLLRDHGATATVTLVSAGDDLVIRPRLYESRPEDKRVSLDRVLGPLGVHRIAGTVCGIDTDRRQIAIVRRDGDSFDLDYDRLVLATGSRLVRPPVIGERYLFDVDTISSAAALESHLLRLPQRQPAAGRFAAVVVGAGFTGIEVATELVDRLRRLAGDPREVSVVLVDQAAVVGAELGEGPRTYILRALAELSIEARLRVTVHEVDEHGVVLSDGTRLTASTVIWTAGLSASPLTRMIPGGRDALGRLTVDELLRVPGVPGVFAAGDTAAPMASDGETVMQSCQHAMPQGRYAGHNAVADLLGLPSVSFATDPYVTCLDLGGSGAVFTHGRHRVVQLAGEEAKAIKRKITSVLIYPPLGDPDALLAQASPRLAPGA